ncbi:hypothetical protein GCM10017083_15020 [Thalassobaculum fulvum]|uniref:GmrSD restriction endonucleases N-terminal domain-containing protein n=1 Tax=Thalassobaculum fulvum TaxID=1633335 RepID=A0A919CNP8_9PROT|nr:DUF262 domain-containing protein [Thalassobaculum fulvum]GHD46175.1 hypothetical protein GCM10017083_15020 [Thalassobaculum fulvum]
MRASKATVQMYHLSNLVEGVAQGTLGIPEFQRDFDWSETDIRSLLATVFLGWPAGSLLFLEGSSTLFELRPMEGAPQLDEVSYAVLDGQQRLTSLYQALYESGESVFAIKWDLPEDQELEDLIVSYRKDVWDRQYSSLTANLDGRVIPVSCLKSATDFFSWRDDVLKLVDDIKRREILKKAITDFYTYKLSPIHSYEFPVVLLSKKTDASAIARIFEKVNKTGLTLNTFDLMVAKSFDPGWNLRERWIEAKEKFVSINDFFGDDGMPLLQAIALMSRKVDLRQSAVLNLSKYEVQENWDSVIQSTDMVVQFLRRECGVLRREYMPYSNLLPPFIALQTDGRLDADPDLFSEWFWYASFAGAYDAAANTRLVSHFKSIRAGDRSGYRSGETRVLVPATATKKSQKALWNAVVCAAVSDIENRMGSELSAVISDEMEVANLFALDEVEEVFHRNPQQYRPEVEFRGALNIFLVPRRTASVIKRTGAEQSVAICMASEFSDVARAQLPAGQVGSTWNWDDFRVARAKWLVDFMKGKQVSGVEVILPGHGESLASRVVL